eukprot:2988769-Alexandrium_andersonii.AAC.1
MSASLVGSEMCIRDSSKRGSRMTLPQCSKARWDAARPPPRSSRERCRSAVSYTHLTLPTICSV